MLSELIKGFVDVFMVSETKLDDSFPEGQFFIDGFHTPFRYDRNSNGGGILLYVRENTPAKVIHCDFPTSESVFVEINLVKKKWLINFSYNPHKNNIGSHLNVITKALHTYYGKYENVVFLGDFNAGIEQTTMKSFCESYNLTNFIKQPTSFKNPEKPSCFDLLLTNRPKSFQSTHVIETGLSDFDRMTVFGLKMHFRKLPPRIISYRNFSNYHNANFINSLTEVLFEVENTESLIKDRDCFYKVCNEVLNQHPPRKKKYVRGNNKPFMNNALSTAIIQRTKLRNIFMKDPSAANKFSYSKQRNWCVSLLRKEKKKHFANLNKKDITDNKNIWQTIEPFHLFFQRKLNREKELL